MQTALCCDYYITKKNIKKQKAAVIPAHIACTEKPLFESSSQVTHNRPDISLDAPEQTKHQGVAQETSSQAKGGLNPLQAFSLLQLQGQ